MRKGLKWTVFWHSLLYLWPQNTRDAHEGERQEE